MTDRKETKNVASGKPGVDPRALELPPDLISAIIEALLPKILQAIIDAILGRFSPAGPPPVVVNPPPVIVAPPPYIDPGPPGGPPARPQESWLQAGATVFYHNWFKGSEEQDVPAGNSTPHETELVRIGQMGFPPEARAHISADPMPTNCIEYPYPKIHVIRKREDTGFEEEQVLTVENPQPESWVIIQGGQTASGIYLRSNGHFFILVFDAPAVRSSIRIWMEASNGARSNEFGMPWSIRGGGSPGALSATTASRQAEPFVYGAEPTALVERTLFDKDVARGLGRLATKNAPDLDLDA